MAKTWDEINERIVSGAAVVLTAEEFAELAAGVGVSEAAARVDVVTTGTFGPMCSSGVMLNFGHSDPPIRMSRITLNDVEAYGGLAAVDTYLGVTQQSSTRGIEYGGAHVIEDLLAGKAVRLRAWSSGTDCYPRTEIDTWVRLQDLNQAYFFNPRNAYQNYAVAVNSSERVLHTYMGTLLPHLGNATYCSAGALSPLLNDPTYRTIGVGSRIFVAGAPGFVAWEGTQHNPNQQRDEHGVPLAPAGTLAVIADMKRASTRFFAAASMTGYGVSAFVGIGVPIPVLDEEIAATLALTDADISATVFDYGVQRRSRPALGQVTYAELRSGTIEVQGKKVPTGPISSRAKAREIAAELKRWIAEERFTLAEPLKPLPQPGEQGVKPLEIRSEEAI
ncbi:homocysteine biosynthesis protein [Coriobacteriia bacterium Es71-Z0120]|uniref:homocysteine biosynthesis protein n=1 Tax=Parvivirga hydrogeniphila TaxID=2939460 RepID=UPI002260C72D|nr:homocysteine biosynthesis protein [Parvivirga hydrogeniphila]MCL4078626.1 homocysteine biosynthesis protein [Parvivirga hydrogeniphila]